MPPGPSGCCPSQGGRSAACRDGALRARPLPPLAAVWPGPGLSCGPVLPAPLCLASLLVQSPLRLACLRSGAPCAFFRPRQTGRPRREAMRPGVFPGCRHCRGLGSGVTLSAAALPWRFSGLAPVAKCAAAPGAPRRCARLDHICLDGAASVAALASPGCAAPAPGCAVLSPCGRPCMGCQPAVFRLLALPAQGAAWVGGWSVHPAGKPGAACVGGVGFGSRVGAALVPALHLARLLSRSRSTRHPVCEGGARRLGRCSRPWCLGAPAPFASVALAGRASRPPGGAPPLRLLPPPVEPRSPFWRWPAASLPAVGHGFVSPTFLLGPRRFIFPEWRRKSSRFGRCRRNGPACRSLLGAPGASCPVPVPVVRFARS